MTHSGKRTGSSEPLDLGAINLEDTELTPEQQKLLNKVRKERNEEAFDIYKKYTLQQVKNKNEFNPLTNIQPTKKGSKYEIPFKLKDGSEYLIIINRDIEWFFAAEDRIDKPIDETKLSIYIENKQNKQKILYLYMSNSYSQIEISGSGSVIMNYYWNAESAINKQKIIKACMIVIRKFFNPANLFSTWDYREIPSQFQLFPLTVYPPVVFIEKHLLANNRWSAIKRINIKKYMTQLEQEAKSETPEQIALNVAKADAYMHYLTTQEWNATILGEQPVYAGGAKKRRVTKKK